MTGHESSILSGNMRSHLNVWPGSVFGITNKRCLDGWDMVYDNCLPDIEKFDHSSTPCPFVRLSYSFWSKTGICLLPESSFDQKPYYIMIMFDALPIIDVQNCWQGFLFFFVFFKKKKKKNSVRGYGSVGPADITVSREACLGYHSPAWTIIYFIVHWQVHCPSMQSHTCYKRWLSFLFLRKQDGHLFNVLL